MVTNNSVAWIPPDPRTLNYTNCTIASTWASSLLETEDVPLYWTLEYLRNGLKGYRNTSGTYPPDAELLKWFLNDFDQNGSLLYRYLLDFSLTNCTTQLCPEMRWQGNSDVAGRGMLVNYCVQAGLATLYLSILLVMRLDMVKVQSDNKSIVSRVFSAIQHSARIFVDTAILFAIAMLIAAIYTFGRFFAHRNTLLTTYATLTTAYLSLYSIVPAVLLHCCVSDNLRRTRWRRLVWAFVAALAIIVIGFYFAMPWMPAQYEASSYDPSNLKDPDKQLNWDMFCLDQDVAKMFDISVKVLVGALALPTIIYGILLFSSRYVERSSLQVVRRNWWLIVALMAAMCMWACLGLFIYFRHQMNKGTGETNKDREWSFGQILGLVTWVPVVVENISILKDGAQKALTGQMMQPYRAVASSRTAQDMEEEMARLNTYKTVNTMDSDRSP